MKTLQSRMLSIATGRSGLSLDKVAAYRALWAAQGYEIPPYEGPELPSVPQMAVNYAKAQVKHVVEGSKTVPAEEKQRRLDICRTNACGLATLVNNQLRCTHHTCGCFMEVKTGWAETKCPLGLW